MSTWNLKSLHHPSSFISLFRTKNYRALNWDYGYKFGTEIILWLFSSHYVITRPFRVVFVCTWFKYYLSSEWFQNCLSCCLHSKLIIDWLQRKFSLILWFTSPRNLLSHLWHCQCNFNVRNKSKSPIPCPTFPVLLLYVIGLNTTVIGEIFITRVEIVILLTLPGLNKANQYCRDFCDLGLNVIEITMPNVVSFS